MPNPSSKRLPNPSVVGKTDRRTKLDNDSELVMRLIGEAIASVEPSSPWQGRVVLGCWAVSHKRAVCNTLTDSGAGEIPTSMRRISPRISDHTYRF